MCGLALWASPLFAQDYIDVEAERRRDEGYQQQPATGYGTPAQSAPQPAQAGAGANAGELLYQLQVLQQEVRELRGKLEEQDYQLRQLREQSLQRYMDIDRRLSQGGAPASTAGTTTAPTSTAPAAPARELPGESDAYRAAYSRVPDKQFSQALDAFKQFLVDFPNGRFAGNAHYWLGELYLVITPPDDESARREFSLLIDQYPDNAKIPDALYKLGRIYFERGDRQRARQYLDRVVNEYADSGSMSVKLSRDFISSNF